MPSNAIMCIVLWAQMNEGQNEKANNPCMEKIASKQLIFAIYTNIQVESKKQANNCNLVRHLFLIVPPKVQMDSWIHKVKIYILSEYTRVARWLSG